MFGLDNKRKRQRTDDEILLILQSTNRQSQRRTNQATVSSATSASEEPFVPAPSGSWTQCEEDWQGPQKQDISALAADIHGRKAFCAPRQHSSATLRWSVPSSHVLESSNNKEENRHPGLSKTRVDPTNRHSGRKEPPSKSEVHDSGANAAGDSKCADAVQLQFPPPDQVQMTRTVNVPDTFKQGSREYTSTWKAALEEELTLRLLDLAKHFHQVRRQYSEPETKKAPSGIALKLQQLMRRSGLPYYQDCELTVYQKKHDGEEGGRSMFLTLKSGLEKSAAFRKDDLWVLSTVPELCVPARGGPGDRLARPFVLMARSCWHGPNNEGRFEVELLCAAPANLRRKQQVFALHGPDASTELAMISTLQSLSSTKLPIMSALLQPFSRDQSASSSPVEDDGTASCQIDAQESSVTSAVQKVIEQFGLNTEQATVLQAMQPWFLPNSKAFSPLCIVHGPFGTGKSMLLVAAMHLLLALRDMEGPLKGCRIAMAAHTNAAVDRIMCGLLHSGQSDLLRVGPLRRIDRSLLPYSLHSTAGKRSEAAQELEAMLKEATSVSEQKILKDELAEVKAGAERKRRRKLKTAAVVGVTCCSAALPVLDDQHFDVVFLDECSQMVEPLSLLPLTRAACRFAVLSGDPLQLPPLIAHPAHVTQRPGAPVAHGLSRPVFERLASMGHLVHLLRRQYRCHPEIAAISNAHFYGGRLLDGCSAAERPPLVRGLPPLLCLDVRGSQEYAGGSHSASNRAEASAVVQVVRGLLTQQAIRDREGSEEAELAVTPQAIGVICFHKAQVALISSLLSRPSGDAADVPSSSDVTVATVDSYQGLEKPIIILSTAVTRVGAFVADPHRLNVALTRAKHHLILVGDAAVLHDTAPAFKALITAARASPGACRQFHPGQPIPLASLLSS